MRLDLEHDAGCKRASAPYGLDRDRCDRCRTLWMRLGLGGLGVRDAPSADEFRYDPVGNGYDLDDPKGWDAGGGW